MAAKGIYQQEYISIVGDNLRFRSLLWMIQLFRAARLKEEIQEGADLPLKAYGH